MSDAVKLALISMIGTLITTIGVALVAYFTYGLKRTTKETNAQVRESAEVSRDTNARVAETGQKVEAVHENTNGRLLAAEAALVAVTADRERLLAEAKGRRAED